MIDERVTHPSLLRTAENLEHVGAAVARTLAALEERFRHELMDDLERLELRERIVRLRRKSGRS